MKSNLSINRPGDCPIGQEKMKLREDFPEDISGFIDDFFSVHRPRFIAARRPWNPPTDVYETQNELVIKMEIAGLKAEDFNVLVRDNSLRIRGRRDEEPVHKKQSYHLMEIDYGNFERVFSLPANVKTKEVMANYDNGFLRIIIPKTLPKVVKVE